MRGKTYIGLFVCASMVSFTTSAQTINVSSLTELDRALAAAQGGETIRLAPGQYGTARYDIKDKRYSSYVTLVSADLEAPAKFNAIWLIRSSFVRLKELSFEHSGREGVGVFNGSEHIQLQDLKIRALDRYDRTNPSYTQLSSIYGVNVNGNLRGMEPSGGTVNDILVENVDVQDVASSAYIFFNVRDSVFRGNRCDWVASDCYKLASADQILFENNFGATDIHPSPTAHIDFVQGQGNVSNSTFRGNVALTGRNSPGAQGLFFDDARYTNLTFENNLIHTSSIRGISVSSPKNGAPSSGIVLRFNTVFRPAVSLADANKNKAATILVPEGSIQENNLVSNITTKPEKRVYGEADKTNVIAQYNKPENDYFYNDYYINATAGRGARIEDFTPVANSLGATKGAFKRINELLADGTDENPGGTPPGPVTPPGPETPPGPVTPPKPGTPPEPETPPKPVTPPRSGDNKAVVIPVGDDLFVVPL